MTLQNPYFTGSPPCVEIGAVDFAAMRTVLRGPGTATTTLVSANDFRLLPFFVPVPTRVVGSCAEVTTAGVAGARAKSAIYMAKSPTNCYPGAQVALSAEIAGFDSLGIKTFAFAAAAILNPGILYWLGMLFNGSGPGNFRAQTNIIWGACVFYGLPPIRPAADANLNSDPLSNMVCTGCTYSADIDAATFPSAKGAGIAAGSVVIQALNH